MSRAVTPRASDRGTRAALWVLYADTFTMAVGFYMLVPLLALHFLDDLALSIALVGVLTAIRSGAQNGLMPLSGWLADRLDYRWAIAAGVLIRAVGFALLGAAETVPALVVASVLTGLGGSLFHPASYAAYAALAADRDPVRVYAMRELLSNLGFVVGPAVGGVLAGVDFRWVGFGAAGMFFAAFVVTVVGLPSGLSGPAQERTGFRHVVRDRAFLVYCGLAAGLWFLVSQLYLVVPVRAGEVLPGTTEVGLVYSGSAVLMVLTMLPLTKAVAARMSSGQMLALGGLALGGGIAAMGLWRSVAGLLVGVGIFTVGQMLAQPTMNAVVSEYAPDGGVASYFGVQGLAHAVGSMVGTSLGGLLYTLDAQGGAGSVVPWLIFGAWGVGLAALLARPGAIR